MIQTEEDLRVMYAEDTGLPIVSEDEKQWYGYWLEKKLLDALKNKEASSRTISSPQLDLNIVAERNKRYPKMGNSKFDLILNEARRESFLEGAKYVKQLGYL